MDDPFSPASLNAEVLFLPLNPFPVNIVPVCPEVGKEKLASFLYYFKEMQSY